MDDEAFDSMVESMDQRSFDLKRGDAATGHCAPPQIRSHESGFNQDDQTAVGWSVQSEF